MPSKSPATLFLGSKQIFCGGFASGVVPTVSGSLEEFARLEHGHTKALNLIGRGTQQKREKTFEKMI